MRTELFQALCHRTREDMSAIGSDSERLVRLFASHESEDWQSMGLFFQRVRSKRRHLRSHFTQLSCQLDRRRFAAQKAAWRASGRFVCRHGMFFSSGFNGVCRCVERVPTWNGVVRMPALSAQLKDIIVVPFDAAAVQRIGVLQAQKRHKDW